MFGTGAIVALVARQMGLSPEEHRPGYLTLYAGICNVAALLASLAGTMLLDCMAIRPVLYLTSAVRLLAGMLFAL